MASGAAPPADQQILDIISSIPNLDTTDANGQNLDDNMDELFGSMNGDVDATLASNLLGENGSQSVNGSNGAMETMSRDLADSVAVVDDIVSKVSQVEQPALRSLVDALQVCARRLLKPSLSPDTNDLANGLCRECKTSSHVTSDTDHCFVSRACFTR